MYIHTYPYIYICILPLVIKWLCLFALHKERRSERASERNPATVHYSVTVPYLSASLFPSASEYSDAGARFTVMATDKDVSGKVIEAVENRNRRLVGSGLERGVSFSNYTRQDGQAWRYLLRLIGLMDSKWRGGGRCKSLS